MQTYSHFLVTAFAQHQLKQRDIPVHTTAILLGSVWPDIPFTILTITYWVYYRWLNPLEVESVMEYLHLDLYFNDPVWIISHNFFHAPFIITLMVGIGWLSQSRHTWGRWLFWFAVGLAFHSVIDILTHHNDGPLLFFPFNWHIRFLSPVSYWHPDHYGFLFASLEHLMNVMIIIYFAYGRDKKTLLTFKLL